MRRYKAAKQKRARCTGLYLERVFVAANAVDACYGEELDKFGFLESSVRAVLGDGAETLSRNLDGYGLAEF